LRQQRSGTLLHFARVDKTEAARLAAKKEIFGDAHISQQIDFLVYGANAQLLSVERVVRIDLYAVECQRPGIAAVGAGHAFDQCGFARAVLAEKRVYFTAAEREIDFVERDSTRKGFHDSAGGENIVGIVHENQRPEKRRLPAIYGFAEMPPPSVVDTEAERPFCRDLAALRTL
jgi:hypothetical protein